MQQSWKWAFLSQIGLANYAWGLSGELKALATCSREAQTVAAGTIPKEPAGSAYHPQEQGYTEGAHPQTWTIIHYDHGLQSPHCTVRRPPLISLEPIPPLSH